MIYGVHFLLDLEPYEYHNLENHNLIFSILLYYMNFCFIKIDWEHNWKVLIEKVLPWRRRMLRL